MIILCTCFFFIPTIPAADDADEGGASSLTSSSSAEIHLLFVNEFLVGSLVDFATPDDLIDILAKCLPATLFLNLGYMNTRKFKKLEQGREGEGKGQI